MNRIKQIKPYSDVFPPISKDEIEITYGQVLTILSEEFPNFKTENDMYQQALVLALCLGESFLTPKGF